MSQAKRVQEVYVTADEFAAIQQAAQACAATGPIGFDDTRWVEICDRILGKEVVDKLISHDNRIVVLWGKQETPEPRIKIIQEGPDWTAALSSKP